MIKESGVVERDSNLEMLIRDLRPFVDKPLGSVRIDMNEVRSILKMHDQQATLIAELQAGMCNGCGSTRTDEQCRKEQKSCCPDRKMLDTAAWRTRALAAESSLHRVRGETIEDAVKCIPTNWCDELLTGPNAPRGPLGSPDVEKLLLAIIGRIRSLNKTGLDSGAIKTAESEHSPSTLNAETE